MTETFKGSRLAIEEAVQAIIEQLGCDTSSPHFADTARRVQRYLVNEACRGMHAEQPVLTSFPNDPALDEQIVVGPISFDSTCAHHLLPVFGEAWIGVIPDKCILGLSKFARAIRWAMAKPTTQEVVTQEIADWLVNELKPFSFSLYVEASHTCMTRRGVRDGGCVMKTSVMYGAARDNPETRAEFFSMVRSS